MIRLLTYCSLLFAFSLQANAQTWIEYKRLDERKKETSFADTMFIYHISPDSMSIRLGGFIYSNKIIDNRLMLSHTFYEIKSHKDDEVVLERKDHQFHYFKKYTPVNRQTEKRPIDEVAARIKSGDKTPIQIDKVLLETNWKAYKRESIAGPIPNLDFKTLIKRVTLKDANDELLGYMKLGNELTYLFKVLRVENGKFVVKDPLGTEYKFHIYALSMRELVFEDHRGMVYYCNNE